MTSISTYYIAVIQVLLPENRQPCRIVIHMPNPAEEIRWLADSVANVMSNNGIHNRNELAKLLPNLRTAIYEAFDENWAGTATMRLMAQLGWHFRVPLGQLVVEPAALRRKLSPSRSYVRPPENRKVPNASKAHRKEVS